MAELPKSVIERMKAQAAPQQHPDADLLTAFSEQALTGRERETVLAHLAACAACRETAALASPQPAAEQPERVLAPWYGRPQIFAWAGTLATLALVGALLLNYGQNRQSSQFMTDATAPKAAPSSPAKMDTDKVAENKPAAPTSGQVMNGVPGILTKNTKNEAPRRDADVAKLEGEQKKQPTEERAMNQVAGGLPAAPPPPMQAPEKDQKVLDGGVLRDQYRASKEPVAKPAPAPSVTAAAPSANTVAERQESTVTAQDAAVESTAARKTANLATSGAAVGGRVNQEKAKAALALPPIRWSLSDKGKLLSSADSGRSWKPALPKETTVFRALAVVDNEVWAGGSGAVILHSADRGISWIRQVLPGAYADVVSLQFDDPQHGLARTADGMAWGTADGGQHWSKR